MNANQFTSYFPLCALTLTNLFVASVPTLAQPIIPANDGVGTTTHQAGNRFEIQGGSLSGDGSNLFHSFERFNLESGQVANFVSNPSIHNILGRVTGGEVSVIQGLIEVTGGNSNLFLMNPAGIIFGNGAALNVPADFTATTATGITFNQNSFNVFGNNNYSTLIGTPSGYIFAVTQPGVILNEGNLTLSPGHNLTLLGGGVINTGQLSSPGGVITLAAVEGENLVRISQTGQLLNLEVSPLASSSTQSTITPLSLPQLLTGSTSINASTVAVNEQGQIILTGSNTIIPDRSGVAIASGNINTSMIQITPLWKGGRGDLETGEIGGNINIFGNLVGVIDANLSASGINGGGVILIGGNFQGKGTVPNATQTFVNGNSFIAADALSVGDGGKIIVWSDETTRFDGNISAKAGEIFGNGGFVEISGKQNLVFQGSVDLSAVNGTPGTILFDPENITIDSEELNSESSELARGKNPFQQDQDANITISAKNVEKLEGNVVLQADNDITVNEPIETSNSVELKAGRSININADIDTSSGNNSIILRGNFDEANAAKRSEGAANINQQEGTILNAGKGNILIQLGSLGKVGEINLADISTKGEVAVNANGGNINRVAEDSLIIGGNALFQTTGTGGVGTETEPLRIQVKNLEGVAGSGGIFFDATQSLIIGGVQEEMFGLSTTQGGDISLSVDGNLTANEDIFTEVDFLANSSSGDINIIAKGFIDTAKVTLDSSSSQFDAGHITLNADDNIIIGSIDSSSSFSGKGGEITLESTNGMIDTTAGTLSSSSGESDGGNITLTAKDNIITSNIYSYAWDAGKGGNITLKSINGMINTSIDIGALDASSSRDEGGNITLTADGNIITSYISSYSAGAGKAGQVSLESINGIIDTSLGKVNVTSSEGDAGNITLRADGNITTGEMNAYSYANGNGGTITLESTNGIIDTTAGTLNSYSNQGDGGTISLTADKNIITGEINSSSSSGKGGAITLESTNGKINTNSGALNSFSTKGEGGDITLTAAGVVSVSDVNSRGAIQGGDVTLTSRFGDVLTLGTLKYGASQKGESGDLTINAFLGNIDLGKIEGPKNLFLESDDLEVQQGEVKLQAHNDIIIREPLETDQISTLQLRAGRNIKVNADIDTSGGNGNIFLQANDSGADADLRGAGTGNILMAEGITLNAGSGNITLQLGNFGNKNNIGDIIISNLQTSGNVTVNALGGNILLRSPNALIQAENAIFQTQGEGGIGSSEQPLRLEVNFLEASAGKGGAFFESPQGNLTVGGASSLLSGIVISEGGDIELNVAGNLKIKEQIFTNSGVNSNSGNITINADGNIDSRGVAVHASPITGDAGNITLSATGNIQTGDIFSASKTGNAGNVTIYSSAGSINTTQGNIYSSSSSGNAGDVTLSANGNLQTLTVYSSSTAEKGNSGNLALSSTAGAINTSQGDIYSAALNGNAGNITVSAERNIQTRQIYSSSTDKGSAGNLTITSTSGIINTTKGDIYSSSGSVNNRAGNITLSADGDIQTGNVFFANGGNGNTGNISISSTSGAIDTAYGFYVSTDTTNGNTGNIIISAKGDIYTNSVNTDVASLGDAGDITISSTSGAITTRDTLTSSANIGNAGNVTLSADGDIRISPINASGSTVNRGNAGNITISSTSGAIDTTLSNISASAGNGNGGDLTLSAKGNIQTGYINLSNPGKGNAGNLTISSTDGGIDTTSTTIYVDADNGNVGNIFLTAKGDIQTQGISSSNSGTGNSGNITLSSSSGGINTTQGEIYSLANNGNAGNIILTAEEDIQTRDVYSSNSNQGNAGNVIISSASGEINTTQGYILSSAKNGNTGDITLSASGQIQTSQVDVASAFEVTLKYDSSVGFSRPIIDFNNPVQRTSGFAGNITITSSNGSINTTGGAINAQAPDGSGNILLNANRNITTGLLTTAALNTSKPTQGGNIEINSASGNINLTETLETFSERGTAGNVSLNARGEITTEQILSSGYEQGGNLNITSNQSSITANNQLETYSEKGIAGDVNLLANDSIIINGVLSEGFQQGGNLNITSEQSNINAKNPLETYSEKGIAGDVNLLANDSIIINGIRSEGLQQGGHLTLSANTGEIKLNEGNLETFSDRGIAGDVTLTATGSIQANNITSSGSTESGNVTITSQAGNLLTQNIKTQADNGPAGNIQLNSYGIQGNIESANLSSFGETLSGNITVKAADGSVRTENILTRSTDGNSGDVDVEGSGDVTTGNIRTEGETGSGDINVESEDGSVTTGNLESVSELGNSGNININASEDILTGFISSRGGRNSGDINVNSRNGSVTTGDVESIALDGTSGDITIIGEGDLNIGDITTVGTEGSGEVTLISENGEINYGDITIGNPAFESAQNNANLDSILIQNQTPILTNEAGNANAQNPILTDNKTSIFSNSNQITVSNQSINSPVISPNASVTDDNFNPNQADIPLDWQVNTSNLLTLANEAGILELEQNRADEFKAYFGDELSDDLVTIDNARNVLKNIQQQTGNRSAVIYVSIRSQQLELVIFTAEAQPRIYTVPISKTQFSKVQREFLDAITSPRLRQSQAYQKSAQQLYQWLIKPLESQLNAEKINTLLFSMDSGLRSLPIAALHDGEQFLIEKYSLSLIPSISLMDTQYRSLANEPVLGMGASEFTELQALPAVPLELEIITQQLRSGKSFLNEEFTQANLMKQRQEYPYRIVHLATHSEFKPGNVENSFIQLWQDERLYLNQLRQLKWNNPVVDLLVLSSCRTALGDEQAELGFAGLAVQAGVKSALASLWYVSDEGTLGLMTEFYASLNQTPIKAEALRHAQIAMIRRSVEIESETLRGTYLQVNEKSTLQLRNQTQQDFSHPYYWSGFTMVGSPW